jgi:hypothetical protein
MIELKLYFVLINEWIKKVSIRPERYLIFTNLIIFKLFLNTLNSQRRTKCLS